MSGVTQLGRRTRARLRALRGLPLGLVLFGAGLVSGLGFAPFHIQPVYLLALCLLVLSLDDARLVRRPLRAGFWRGWAFAAGLFLAGTFWVANAFFERGGSYAAFFWVPLVFMPAGLALFWGVAGALYARFSRAGPGRIVEFAAVFMAAEYIRATQLSGFPWNLPGHVWAAAAGDLGAEKAVLHPESSAWEAAWDDEELRPYVDQSVADLAAASDAAPPASEAPSDCAAGPGTRCRVLPVLPACHCR